MAALNLVGQSGLSSLRLHLAPISSALLHTSSLSPLLSADAEDVRPLANTDLASMQRGTGGRSSFNGIVATIFGSSGFIGRYICNRLGKSGTQLILPYRGDHYDMLRLKLVGDLGQVLFQPYHLEDETSLRKAMRYSNVVVNLIGRDWETMNFNFDAVHNQGARRIARIAKEVGVRRLIHFSSLNAAEKPESVIVPGGSRFLSSKWHGEQAVREEFPDATIIRPADVWGQEDRFLCYYAHWWRHQIRWMPLWFKGEKTLKQPVYVGDVASAVVNAARDDETAGKVYEAVGPRRYQLSELVDWFHRVMRKDQEWGYKRYDLRWDPVFQLRITLTQKICPSWPVGYLGWDKLERDHVTDVLTPGVPTLEDLGVALTTMEERINWELRPFRAGAYYDEELGEFTPPAPPKVYNS